MRKVCLKRHPKSVKFQEKDEIPLNYVAQIFNSAHQNLDIFLERVPRSRRFTCVGK